MFSLDSGLVSVLCLLAAANGEIRPPQDGLRLHLDASCGLDMTGGRVHAWRDGSGRAVEAIVPENAEPPARLTSVAELNGRPAVRFSGKQLLKIARPVVPPSSRSMTIIAIARTRGPTGVSIFAIRQGLVPLVQLDTDSQGSARFILRDKEHRTLQSLGDVTVGRWGVYTGVLRPSAIAGDETGEIQVFFCNQPGQAERGVFRTPVAGDVAWVGGLPLGGRTLSWNGEIAELLVYDRALADGERVALCETLCQKYGLRFKQDLAARAERVYPWQTGAKPATKDIATDVCIVGAGSAGTAAALAAARRGARVVLVERQSLVGGTGVNALVTAWEPGPGCSIAREIFDRLSRQPGATGVACLYPNATNSFSMGQWYVTPGLTYEASLRRAGVPRDQTRCVPYDPLAFARVLREMLDETQRVTLLANTTFFHAEANETRTRVTAILVQGSDQRVTRIRAKVFIDSTGCIHLARSVGCEVMLGADSRERFDEPSAPRRGHLQLNAISRCYRVRPSDHPRREPPVAPPVPQFLKTAHVTGWRHGPRVINPLAMLPGRAMIDLGYERCMEITDKAVRAHWRWLQSTPDFTGYELEQVAPMLGIRESYRLVARYVLTEHDLRAGLSGQTHPDIIAVADHPCDVHGAGSRLTPVNERYGVPYRCLIPAGSWENLLVACRGAGFSKIAASSCRLQRTMIQLGHAAGAAAAMAVETDRPVDKIDVERLVQELRAAAR